MSGLSARDVWAAPPGAPDPAVRGVSLEVGAGEWIALHGPNGGGKTTLAMVLGGLWPAQRGVVEFEGRPLQPGAPAAARAAVAVVMQDPGIQLLQSTVAAELAMAPRNLGRAPGEVAREIARLSEQLDLTADLERDPRELSAGRQQLVLLAAALAARPRLLIADEAGAHLDAATRGRVLEVLRQEVAEGLALVWVTQDPQERAAAHRELIIGELDGVSHPAFRAESGPPGVQPALVVVEVAPPPSCHGPRVPVAAPLSIEVAAAGVTALEGPNGAGKSVLLAAIAGAIELPQVRVDWRRTLEDPPLLATQYPEHEIFEEQVLAEVTWAAVQRGAKRQAAVDTAVALLEELGCGALEGRRVWGLSGGEKRVVQLVGALTAPAGLLLLDEPTAGLDRSRRAAAAAAILRHSLTTPVMVASQDPQWLDSIAARRVRLST